MRKKSMTDTKPFSAMQYLRDNTKTTLIYYALVFVGHVGWQILRHEGARAGTGVSSYFTVEVVVSSLLVASIAVTLSTGLSVFLASRRAKAKVNA